MQAVLDAMIRVQSAMDAGGAQLTQLRTSVLQAVVQLEGEGWQVAPDGTVSVRPGGALDVFAQISPVNALMIRILAARNTPLKKLLAEFEAADHRTDQAVRQAVDGLNSAGAGGGRMAEPQIPDTKDPYAVNRWWTALTPEQRAQVP